MLLDTILYQIRDGISGLDWSLLAKAVARHSPLAVQLSNNAAVPK